MNMARITPRPPVTSNISLDSVQRDCPSCGEPLRFDYLNRRTVTTLDAVVRLNLRIRRCQNQTCGRYHKPYRPEEEGRWALPVHEFGLDVIALVGALRYQDHRTVTELHAELQRRGVAISPRSVTNLLDRYDELLALSLTDSDRLQDVLRDQGRVILALDGLQPDVGHEVLWVLRDCVSGEVLLARSMLSATEVDLAALIQEVKARLPVPIEGVISDGQHSIRNAVASSLPGVPHALCQFHYLREAGHPVYEADRHAKKELKKRVRGVRAIERGIEGRDDPIAQVIEGYCSAVRSALTDDGRPPLAASGLQLHERLSAISDSLDRVGKRGMSPRSWSS
jgi:hypothetical protein